MGRKEDIIRYAKDLKITYRTNDPFALAERFGISVISKDSIHQFTAHTIRSANLPILIAINSIYSGNARTVLCAHELGHALLHEDYINHFAVTSDNAFTEVEYEADLFAVALLFDEKDFNIPIAYMSNYTLRSILEYNLE